MANPLLGRICISKPAGISTNSPVGTNDLSSGLSVTGIFNEALISMPDDPPVAYCGNGLEEVLMILICTVCIRANIKFDRQRIRYVLLISR